MPVPSYTPIADSELDPESPITSSLMFRLRDNFLAVFGINTTDPTPTPTVPPSWFQYLNGRYHVSDTISAASVGYFNVGNTAIKGELTECSRSCIEVKWFNGTDGDYKRVDLGAIEVEYSGGVPTGVRLRSFGVAYYTRNDYGGSLTWSGAFEGGTTILLPLNDTFQDLLRVDGPGSTDGFIRAKARTVGSDLQVDFDSDGMSGSGFSVTCRIDIQFTRKQLVNKAS